MPDQFLSTETFRPGDPVTPAKEEHSHRARFVTTAAVGGFPERWELPAEVVTVDDLHKFREEIFAALNALDKSLTERFSRPLVDSEQDDSEEPVGHPI